MYMHPLKLTLDSYSSSSLRELTRHGLVLQRHSSSLAVSLTSSIAKGGLAGNHPGAIHPNPICGITYDTTIHDKLRKAWRGAGRRRRVPPPSTRRAKYHVPTRNVAMAILRWSENSEWTMLGHHGSSRDASTRRRRARHTGVREGSGAQPYWSTMSWGVKPAHSHTSGVVHNTPHDTYPH